MPTFPVQDHPGPPPVLRRRRDLFRARARVAGRGDTGMTTAEYAVGTVAACGFGGILYKLLTSSRVSGMLSDLLERALSVGF